MSQLPEDKAVRLLQSRLAKFQLKLSDEDAHAFLVLLRAQGWKLTAREATTDMLDRVNGAKFGPGSEYHTSDLIWQNMWDQA